MMNRLDSLHVYYTLTMGHEVYLATVYKTDGSIFSEVDIEPGFSSASAPKHQALAY